MKPTSKQVDGFRVAGISVRTSNRNESSPETGKLGALWGRFYQEGIPGRLTEQASGSQICGVYSDYESDVDGEYTVTAGMQIAPSATVEAGLTSVDVAAGEYLVFTGKGPMPQVVIDTWQAAWRYFSEDGEFKRAYLTDFEAYQGQEEVAIHISVVRI